MAVLRLANGTDVTVKLSVAETVAALSVIEPERDFVEMPGEGGPVHIRPSGVLAIIDETPRGQAGFRIGQPAGS